MIRRHTAAGAKALNANTTGACNTATGTDALVFNSAGSNNTAIGDDALRTNNAGDNTAAGFHALSSNTTGSADSRRDRVLLPGVVVDVHNVYRMIRQRLEVSEGHEGAA